ncbi:MAG: proteasome assembly chaperone family protein [Candidatus Woesearchaeota archaeon]
MPQIDRKIKPRVAIVAFPSFGLVGNIALEFLKEHLKTEKIGRLFMDEMVPLIVVHNNHFVEPISFYYNEKYKILLIEGINKITGLENRVSSRLVDFMNKANVKEVITLDGVPGVGSGVYYYSKHKIEVFEKSNIKLLDNGIIFGITASLLLKMKNVVSLFAEANSELPDSNAAARIVKALDNYLGLKIDYEPLFEQAKNFERKIKDILNKSEEFKAKSVHDKSLNYLG